MVQTADEKSQLLKLFFYKKKTKTSVVSELFRANATILSTTTKTATKTTTTTTTKTKTKTTTTTKTKTITTTTTTTTTKTTKTTTKTTKTTTTTLTHQPPSQRHLNKNIFKTKFSKNSVAG